MSLSSTTYYDRHGLLITLIGAALLPFIIYASVQELATNSNEVKDWLPEDYVEAKEFQWFRQHFPNDEFILVTWEGCTVEDPRLDEFVAKVRSLASRDAVGKLRFPNIVTGRTAISELQTAYSTLSREDAIQKLRGSLVGPDGQQTCAIVSLTDDARRDVRGTLQILEDATLASGVPPKDLHMGGTTVLNAAIDRVSGESLNRVLILCCIVVSLVAWWLIRNLGLMLMILFTGLYSAGVSLAVLWLTGTKMNAILITMIPMVYVAATSGAIHLCNYYVESVREAGPAGAADRAIAHAWLPLGLATATTAAGLLSICYTDLVLIRAFGIYSAIGVALSWVLLVVWLPAALTVWGRRALPAPAAIGAETVTASEHETGEATLPAFWERFGDIVSRRPSWFAVPCLAVWLACIPGVQSLSVSIDFMKEFRPDSDLIRTYAWLEEKLGALMPLEVILRIDEGSNLSIADRVRLMERLQRRFEKVPDVGGTISVATHAPEIESDGPDWLKQGIRNRRLEADRGRLLATGYLTETESEELWRVSVRVVALREVDYAGLLRQLKLQVDQELDSEPESLRRHITATYTGFAPVLYKARQSLVDGLFWGIAADLALIVITVALLMRHWSSGLLMAVTTLFPAIIVLGLAGWLGIRVGLGAIMAPCVALGVTVDDVVHFLLWFKAGVVRGMNQRDAVILAWRACVRPMYQSWTLLGLGMGCLLISDFLPILQFGMVMLAMLTVGLIGNLMLLPALLAGPLGRVIAASARRQKQLVIPTHGLGFITRMEPDVGG